MLSYAGLAADSYATKYASQSQLEIFTYTLRHYAVIDADCQRADSATPLLLFVRH